MKKTSIDEVQRTLRERIQTEGVLAAYEAALSICLDPKSPHPAKATASATIFRVAGYFDTKDGTGAEKQPHEMTPDELDRAVRQALAAAEGVRSQLVADESIFD